MKILVIEDESGLAQSITSYLEGENYVCEVAAIFNEASDKIGLFYYDCILLDSMLPDGDGLKLLEELKKEKKQDGVIIISAKDSEDRRRRLPGKAFSFIIGHKMGPQSVGIGRSLCK